MQAAAVCISAPGHLGNVDVRYRALVYARAAWVVPQGTDWDLGWVRGLGSGQRWGGSAAAALVKVRD
jgi:hypothetical protein